MKKRILINQGVEKELSFEEVVEEYQNLIWKTIRNFKGLDLEDDDKYQMLIIQLWKCYQKYNAEIGVGFGHYAKLSLWGTLGRMARDERRRKATGVVVVSADEIIFDNDWNDVSRIERIEDKHDFVDEIMCNLKYQRFLNMLSEKQRDVIKLYITGLRQVDIANILGIFQGTVAQRINKSRLVYKRMEANI